MSLTKRIDEARRAFRRKDRLASMEAHSLERIRTQHSEPLVHGSASYIGELVYGGLDGIITTFAIVSGVAGAGLSSSIVLILGAANLLADGFSMATAAFLSARSERERYDLEREREAWEIDHFPEAEREELVQAYKLRGFTDEEVETLTDIHTRDKDRWIDAMMIDELGMLEDNRNPLRIGLATFVAFAVAGLVPLIAYVAGLFVTIGADSAFLLSAGLSGLALFVLGASKTLVTGMPVLRSGLETLAVGGVAAAVAYGVGKMLAGLGL